MYRCQKCKQVSKPRELQYKVTTRFRDITYQHGSQGKEIVEEISVCESCYKELQSK